MNKRILVALAAAAAAIASTIGCGVTASGAQYTDATSVFWVMGHDHVPYRIQVELLTSVSSVPSNAYANEATFAYLVVSGSRCPAKTCGAATSYMQSLVDNQYDNSNLTNIWAHTGAYNGGLTVTWKGAGPSGPLDTTPNADTSGVDLSSTWAATATLQAFGAKCTDVTAIASRHTHAAPEAMSTPVGKPAPFRGGNGLPTGKVTCTTPPRH
jgi:Tfp pilus assembly protein PilV